MRGFRPMKRIATFLRPVPVASTALVAVTGAWLAWSPIAGADTQTAQPPSVVDLVARTSPAVVTVLATQDEQKDAQAMPGDGQESPFPPGSPFDEFFRRFG